MFEFTARRNQKLHLTSRQLAILLGCLLGDGYIHPRGQIQIAQSSKQSDYTNWKYQELASLAYGAPSTASRFDPRYGKSYQQSRFWLRQFFRPWRKLFYPKGRKVVPKEILVYISELSLAVWYMDDGNFFPPRQVTIATDGYGGVSRKRLQELLLNFDIESSILSSGKMRILASSRAKFFELVKPYIHSSMAYKIP